MFQVIEIREDENAVVIVQVSDRFLEEAGIKGHENIGCDTAAAIYNPAAFGLVLLSITGLDRIALQHFSISKTAIYFIIVIVYTIGIRFLNAAVGRGIVAGNGQA